MARLGSTVSGMWLSYIFPGSSVSERGVNCTADINRHFRLA